LQSQEKQRLKSTERSKLIVKQNRVVLPPVKIYEQQGPIKGDTFYRMRQTESFIIKSEIDMSRRNVV